MSDEGQLRALLAEYGGWVYFVCGAYREDGHRATCEIGRALTEVAA